MQEMQEIQGWSLGQEDPLEKEMVTYSSIKLALQKRKMSIETMKICLENSMDRGIWWIV